ncbi:hypothetical protein [Massilia alkalitolerans]|uniref:hypothetical protein n=1 Tax=Massilia alkalitolerans TaxID=286638 RepID=UPI0028A87455|nr:hypothetical protein [Massilia alkalitolerans]
MPFIEYTCLVEGSEALHVIKPDEPGANDNQYVLIFEGIRDWSLACITGDWEWQSVVERMNMAASYLAATDGPRTKTFAVGSMARTRAPEADFCVGAELQMAKILPSSGDTYGRLTIRLEKDSQEPYFRAHSWKGMDDRTFRIYRKDNELERLGRLFQRLDEASFEPVFTTAINDWFIPWRLRDPSSLAWLALPEIQQRCIGHIRESCPAGFSKFWTESIAALELPCAAQCPKCKAYFPRRVNERWRKVCLGCYRDEMPTSFTREQISAASIITPWLESPNE